MTQQRITLTTFTTSWLWLPTTRQARTTRTGMGMIDETEPDNEVASNKAYKKVTITVTDVPEPGIVTLSSLQPQVETPLRATSQRPRSESVRKSMPPTWKWEQSRNRASGWTALGGRR